MTCKKGNPRLSIRVKPDLIDTLAKMGDPIGQDPGDVARILIYKAIAAGISV